MVRIRGKIRLMFIIRSRIKVRAKVRGRVNVRFRIRGRMKVRVRARLKGAGLLFELGWLGAVVMLGLGLGAGSMLR